MDKIAIFSRDMKMLLIRKEKFYKLCYVCTISEDEAKDRIIIAWFNDLMQSIVDIFENRNIPMGVLQNGQQNRNISKRWIVVQCYNHLLLNTCFYSQPIFKKDFLYGHVVNVWPTISPYLFIRIIWLLEYDEVLVESLQHVPLDLCIKILEATISCLDKLEDKRAKSLIFSLINMIYCKCLWLHWNIHKQLRACITYVKEFLHQLVAHFQTFIMKLFPKSNQSPSNMEICIKETRKQRGILLKHILRHTRLCMCKKLSSNVINPNLTYKADMYRLMFGIVSTRTYRRIFTNHVINSVITMLDQQLFMLVLDQIQQIDYRECLDWAQIEDEEDRTISLQYAVAIECHNFMEYMKRDNFLVERDHLRQLLQQLINWSNFSNPENTNRFGLTLQELCNKITDEPKYMRELMERYKEWDESTLDFISGRMHLLESNFFLLEYLHYVFANSLNRTKRNEAYVWVMTMLHQADVMNVSFDVLKYTKQHFQDNYLECMYNDKTFHEFMKNGMNIHDSQILRKLLLYILLNAKKVLTILVKIVVGDVKYEPKNVTFTSHNLLSLREFLCIKVDEEYNLLLVILKEICFGNGNWNSRKFHDFIPDMLRYEMIETDQFINYFCIPYLMSVDVMDNYYHVLFLLRSMATLIKKANKINYILLIIVLTKNMSLIRRYNESPGEILTIAYKILSYFPKYVETRNITRKWRKLSEYNYTIGNWLEPIDWARMLKVINTSSINALHMIQNYETRCFPIHKKLRIDARWKMQTNQTWHQGFTPCVRINRESFIRHMMLRASVSEFQSLMYALITLHYHLGWNSNLEAYENIVRIATEALQLTMVYFATFPHNAFWALLYSLVKFCKKCAQQLPLIDHELSCEVICRILLGALLSLKLLMTNTKYRKSYDSFFIHLDAMFAKKAYENVKSYFHYIIKWMKKYFKKFGGKIYAFEKENFESTNSLDIMTNSGANTNKLLIMYQEYRFICDCIALPSTETYGHLAQNIRNM